MEQNIKSHMNVTLSDYQNRPCCSMTDWLYQLLFYKKTVYTAWDTDTSEILYEFRKTNRFRCGRDKKLKLLNTHGHHEVCIQFHDCSYNLLVEQILTLFGWKYLLNNVEYIYDLETGEIYYDSIPPVFVCNI